MRIALLGFDVEGRASFEFFKKRGDEITICDQNRAINVPDGISSQLGDVYLENLDRFDVLVRTPGLQPAMILEKNPTVKDKITSATNLFYEHCPTENIIGVTGTKGKGTTSTLITKILEEAGKTVWLGGNIGVPALSFLDKIQPNDWVVLETSSFQACDMKYSPHRGVCLMVVPEHLNWHKDFDDYVNAKRNLFSHQTAADFLVYNADNDTSRNIASSSPAFKIWYSTQPNSITPNDKNEEVRGASVTDNRIKVGMNDICGVEEVALLGRHNLQNVCAAISATWDIIEANENAVRSVVTSFRGLEHRLELVRSLHGVAYYDDSFGTTPETAIVAIQAFDEPKIVILGGSDKGADYDTLAQLIRRSNIKHVLLIGDTAPKIQQALDDEGYTDYSPGGDTMAAIVNQACSLAEAGDVVLLSPGCASFDMFNNYKDRGRQFQQAVNALTD